MRASRETFLPWGVTLTCIAALFFPRLLVEGMFGDGLCYASIARNMAIGKGSFWAPFFSSSFWLPYNQGEVFYEQPPLMMGLQALFFQMLGEHWMVEKIFCVFVLGSSIGLMVWLWKLLCPARGMGWLPLLLWYTMAAVIWAYPNNLLDSFMGMFCLAAVGVQLLYLKEGKSILLYQSAAGLLVYLAFLSKGVPGLFPLVTPVIYALSFNERSIGETLKATLLAAGSFVLLLILTWQHEPARDFFVHYLDQHLLSALSGSRETASTHWWGHFTILWDLLQQVIPATVLLVTGYVAFRSERKQILASFSSPYFRFFLLIGLSASLPILLSPKQRHAYLLPALPYFAMAMAVIAAPMVEVLREHFSLSQKAKRIAFCLLSIFALSTVLLSGMEAGKIGRNKNLILDMRVFSKEIPEGTAIAVCPQMMEDMAVHVYLQRYRRYELSSDPGTLRYALSRKGCNGEFEHELQDLGFKKMPLPLQEFAVWYK